MELFKILDEDEKKNNEKQLKHDDKYLKLKLSEFDKNPTPSNRLNRKINSRQSTNNIVTIPTSNCKLKKIKTLNDNKDKIISNNSKNISNANKNHLSSKKNKFDYSIDKIYTNENRENVKKYKIVINNTDTKKVKSQEKEITENDNNNNNNNNKIIYSDLKHNKIKNTFLGKPLFLYNALAINSNEMRNSRKTTQNLNMYTIKKDSNKIQDLHIKTNNNNMQNQKNKNKNFSTKNIQLKNDGKSKIGRKCYISNQNIIKLDVSKKPFNDFVENGDQRKGNKKKKKFDFEKELKLKKPIKHDKFQSLIAAPKKEEIFISDISNKKLIKVDKKKVKKKISKKKDSSYESLIRNILDSSSFSKSYKNEKSFDSNKNNKLKYQQYKMNHINSISLGRYLKRRSSINNQIIKVPAFTVVKPDKLISFEFDREYETRNRSFYMNKNDNVNDETNIKEKKDFSQKSEHKHRIKKKKSFFCCL